MHAQLSCRFSDCMPTCRTITLHYNQGFATGIYRQLRYSTDNTGLVFQCLIALLNHNRNVTLACFIVLQIQNKDLYVVRSDIQLNLGIRTDH